MRGIVLREAELAALGLGVGGICGVDEAGRGPLAGPVCAAAVVLPEDFPVGILGDSKVLSPARREKAYAVIADRALDWAVGWATHEEIGRLNILGASLLAMRRAVLALVSPASLVLVDGNSVPEALPGRVLAVVKGDALVPAIMAASILAKVARDRLMARLDLIQPEYGFSAHKGYPTEAHRAAIKKAGPSLWARPGFRVS